MYVYTLGPNFDNGLMLIFVYFYLTLARPTFIFFFFFSLFPPPLPGDGDGGGGLLSSKLLRQNVVDFVSSDVMTTL